MKYGRYEVVSELGRGSMGMVFQAHDPQINRLIALKVLREDRLTSEDYVKRFLKEATAVGRLSHSGIVTVYDVGQDHGTVYIAMEFLEGQPLDVLIKKGVCTLQDIVRIGIQAAKALDYAHERGIVHRDIKPPNIICDQSMRIKITDFGIAHIDDPDGQQMTRAGEILGTPVYMAPEQVLGGQVDGRSDIYSLGVILYELTTGQRPFQGESLASLFQAITLNDPVAPDQLNRELPPALCQVIMKAMARKPEDRFAVGRELVDHLRRCLDSSEQSPFFAQTKQRVPRQRRAGWPLFLLITLLLSGAGLAAYRYLWPLVVEVSEKKEETDISAPAVSSPKAERETEHNFPEKKSEEKRAAEQKNTLSESKGNAPDSTKDSYEDLLEEILSKEKSEQSDTSDEKEPLSVPEPQLQPEQPDNMKNSGKMITVRPSGLKKVLKRETKKERDSSDELLDEILSEKKPEPASVKPEPKAEPAPVKPEQPPVSEKSQTTKIVPPASAPSGQAVRPRRDDKLFDKILSEKKQPESLSKPVAEEKKPVSLQPKDVPEPIVQPPLYKPEKKKQDVPKPIVQQPPYELEKEKQDSSKKFATLTIKSRPPKAKFYLDGEYKGETPVELQVSAAKHEVILELQGHLDWKAQLDLSKGDDLSVSPRLAPE